MRGTIMVLVAMLAWSFAGLFTRLLSIDVWTAVAYRSLAGGLMLFIPYLLRRRTAALRELFAVGPIGWIAVLLSTIGQAGTTAGLFLTSVAHVTVIYATCPFIAALVARVWLGEAVPRATLFAIALSFGGILLVVSGTGGVSSWQGDAVALVMTVAFAFLIVLAKAYPDLKLLEITMLSAFLTFFLFMPLAGARSLDPANAAILCLYGFVNMVLAFFLFIKGARVIPAATSGLIATLEIALSPFWVWLFFNETIDRPTFLGGAVVAVTIVGHLAASLLHGRGRSALPADAQA